MYIQRYRTTQLFVPALRALFVLPPVGLSTVFEADEDPHVKMSHVNFTVLHNMLWASHCHSIF